MFLLFAYSEYTFLNDLMPSVHSAFPVQEVILLKCILFCFARFDQFETLAEFSSPRLLSISIAENIIVL